MTTPNIYLDEPVRASTFNRFGFHVGTWTPRLTATTTDPVLGDGSEAEGSWMQLGQVMYVWGRLRFGTSTGTPPPSAGSGNYTLHLPTHVNPAVSVDVLAGLGTIIGTGEVGDNNSVTINSRKICLQLLSLGDTNEPATMAMFVLDGTTGRVSDSAPFTWAARDRIAFFVSYPTDFLRGILL